ncbi:MAG TPA: hypothetical protein VFX86_00915, partial [Candidatus Saccharimonadales bacterium]|nr:hypothetical protein [Candidatus Saccharimonadales bacterium]
MKNSLDVISVSAFDKPVETTANVPGSKSYSLRALFIAALCEKKPKITGLLKSDDTSAMKECLKSIKYGGKLNARDSGTTARFMIAMCCISPGTQIITGSTGLKKRPVAELADALQELGAEIEYLEKDGFLPLRISSSELSGRSVKISGKTSSQYLSALLLIAPTLKDGLQINVAGNQISKPY